MVIGDCRMRLIINVESKSKTLAQGNFDFNSEQPDLIKVKKGHQGRKCYIKVE